MNLRLAVHLHMYYWEMWPEIKKYLRNLEDYPYDLFVTMNERNAAIEQDIKRVHENTVFFEVENRGYDVGPFVYFLHQIDLEKYDLILKIHTKNNKSGACGVINGRWMSRKYWFMLLIEALIGSKSIFNRNIKAFNQDVYLGMIGSKYLITSSCTKTVRDGVIENMERLKMSNYLPIRFVAGTMFMVRSEIMQEIKNNYNIDDFLPSDEQKKNENLAHVLERLFGTLTKALGYKICGFDRNKEFEVIGVLGHWWHFVYQKKITKRNYMQIKVLKLPIYRKKIA